MANGYAVSGSVSVRIDAVLHLLCVSFDGRQMCGERGRYEHHDPEEAIAMARKDGWCFRLKAARCPQCGRAGAAFGRVE